jgi:hypothetical protein
MVIRFQSRPKPEERPDKPSSELLPRAPRLLSAREVEHRQRMLRHLAATGRRA